MLKTGSTAPEFQLDTLEGKRVSLREILAGGPAVLAFFKSTCPVCQFAFPFLERVHRGDSGHALRFYAISQDGAPATSQFLAATGTSFPALLDPYESRFAVSNAYRIRSVPSVFLVEPDGTISATMEGFEKNGIEALGERAGVTAFNAGEDVPAFRPG